MVLIEAIKQLKRKLKIAEAEREILNEERLAKHCFAATPGKSYARSGTKIQKGSGMKSPRQLWFDYYRQTA